MVERIARICDREESDKKKIKLEEQSNIIAKNAIEILKSAMK
jgi:hypothetical protein